MNDQCPWYSAPCATHALRVATCFLVSALPEPFDGIRSSGSSEVIRRIQLALVRVARGDDLDVVVGREQTFLLVEPEVGLAMILVWPVAEEAVLGQDRPDVAVEVDAFPPVGFRRQRHARDH